jgi:hypothetical protein
MSAGKEEIKRMVEERLREGEKRPSRRRWKILIVFLIVALAIGFFFAVGSPGSTGENVGFEKFVYFVGLKYFGSDENSPIENFRIALPYPNYGDLSQVGDDFERLKKIPLPELELDRWRLVDENGRVEIESGKVSGLTGMRSEGLRLSFSLERTYVAVFRFGPMLILDIDKLYPGEAVKIWYFFDVPARRAVINDSDIIIDENGWVIHFRNSHTTLINWRNQNPGMHFISFFPKDKIDIQFSLQLKKISENKITEKWSILFSNEYNFEPKPGKRPAAEIGGVGIYPFVKNTTDLELLR